MNDKPRVLAGLAVFLGLATFPMWYTLVRADYSPPDLEPPGGALKFTAPWPDANVDLEGLRGEFEKHQLAPLSQGAELIEGQRGDVWRIADDGRRYLVLKDKDRAAVSVYDGCVKDRAVMRAEHMSLLIDWRRSVVREGDESCIEINGQQYAKSLTGTCLECHTDKQKFCYRCHEYANALPAWPSRGSTTTRPGIRCWNCHVEGERK
jgi:hypothetical protein